MQLGNAVKVIRVKPCLNGHIPGFRHTVGDWQVITLQRDGGYRFPVTPEVFDEIREWYHRNTDDPGFEDLDLSAAYFVYMKNHETALLFQMAFS